MGYYSDTKTLERNRPLTNFLKEACFKSTYEGITVKVVVDDFSDAGEVLDIFMGKHTVTKTAEGDYLLESHDCSILLVGRDWDAEFEEAHADMAPA